MPQITRKSQNFHKSMAILILTTKNCPDLGQIKIIKLHKIKKNELKCHC